MELRYPLDTWLANVAADALILNDDIGNEATRNMWSFSLSNSEAQIITVAELTQFLWATVEIRRTQILQRSPRCSMLYYCWFDELSGTLRFSLVSENHAQNPPFGCKIFLVDDLEIIASKFLESGYLECIPWEEFQEISPSQLSSNNIDEPELILSVFMIKLH